MIRETELISLKDGKTKNLTDFVKDLAPEPEPMELTPTTPVDTGGADPVELSSYIDGIADTSASDAITAGLDEGGSITNAISSGASAAITEELDTGGNIANAISAAVGPDPVLWKSVTNQAWSGSNVISFDVDTSTDNLSNKELIVEVKAHTLSGMDTYDTKFITYISSAAWEAFTSSSKPGYIYVGGNDLAYVRLTGDGKLDVCSKNSSIMSANADIKIYIK